MKLWAGRFSKEADKKTNDFLWLGNNTSQATEMLYSDIAVNSQAHILYHLSGVDFYHKYAFLAFCHLSDSF